MLFTHEFQYVDIGALMGITRKPCWMPSSVTIFKFEDWLQSQKSHDKSSENCQEL